MASVTVSAVELESAKEDFKFNAAHFVVHESCRERLHGHNYHASVTLNARGIEKSTGYVVDFGIIKPAIRKVCKQLDERFICPLENPYVTVKQGDKNIELLIADGSFFSFPREDVVFLAAVNVSVECLAAHILQQIVVEVGGADMLLGWGVTQLSVAVSETPGQAAKVTADIS